MLTPATRVCPKDEEIAADILDGEAIIINLATGSYYAMNDVGALVWRAIEQHCSLDEITRRVVDGYDVALDRARADVASLAEGLMAAGVIRISEAGAAAGAADSTPRRLPYAPPELSAFNDMRDLLAMDPPMPSVDALTQRSKP